MLLGVKDFSMSRSYKHTPVYKVGCKTKFAKKSEGFYESAFIKSIDCGCSGWNGRLAAICLETRQKFYAENLESSYE